MPSIGKTIRSWFPKKEIFIGSEDIEKILPHRGSKLLLDRVVISPKVFRGELRVRDEHCIGHEVAPGTPLFRGVDISEMAAQLAGFVWGYQHHDYREMMGMLNGIDKVKVRKPVFVGETLIIEIDPSRLRQRILGGPEKETLRIILIARDISVRVKKEKKGSIGSLKIVILSPQSFLNSQASS